MTFRGHPVLGAISGLFFGAFLALLLQQFGIWPLDNLQVFGLPFLGLVLGLVMAWWAPFGRTSVPAPTARPVPAARPVYPPAGRPSAPSGPPMPPPGPPGPGQQPPGPPPPQGP